MKYIALSNMIETLGFTWEKKTDEKQCLEFFMGQKRERERKKNCPH